MGSRSKRAKKRITVNFKMKTVAIERNFTAWRETARSLLAEKIPPAEVIWTILGSDAADELFSFDEAPKSPQSPAITMCVPQQFIALAQTVCCHRSGKHFPMLYEILWAITHGKNPNILQNQTHPTMRALEQLRKTISRDIHKMRAFVRFRQVATGDNGRESYVSWFEPEHFIVRLNTPFFRKRFGGMNWSILTPDECVHWNGEQITFTPGVSKSQAPDADELEELWLGYYSSIFNPARLKIKMMQTEMPKKYWKNLPEADIIQELIKSSSDRVNIMMEENERPLKAAPNNDYLRHLDRLNDL
jgi:uracil-DNA glycosylase